MIVKPSQPLLPTVLATRQPGQNKAFGLLAACTQAASDEHLIQTGQGHDLPAAYDKAEGHNTGGMNREL